jgi:flagellar basal-body rod modification protein FlgD
VAIDPTSSIATSPTTTSDTTSTSNKNNIGNEAFLKLLVVQLQNQDPTNPQSNTEFLSQLATFSSLEQLTSINRAVTSLAKFFEAASPDTDTSKSGSTPGN